MVALSGPITNTGTTNSILYSYGAGVPVTASPGGAVGQAVAITDAVTANGSATLTSASNAMGGVATLLAAAAALGVNVVAVVAGAGTAGAALVTTVSAYGSAGSITLGANASGIATASVIGIANAWFGIDDSVAIQAKMTAYTHVEFGSGKYLALGLKPQAIQVLTGAGAILYQPRLGTGGASDAGIVDSSSGVDSALFLCDGITFQGIQGTGNVSNNQGLRLVGVTHASSITQQTIRVTRCTFNNFQDVPVNIGFCANAELGHSTFNLCSQGPNINGSANVWAHHGHTNGSQFAATSTNFWIGIAFASISGIDNGTVLCDHWKVDGSVAGVASPDCEAFMCHSASESVRFDHCVGQLVGTAFQIGTTVTGETITSVFLDTCYATSCANGNVAHLLRNYGMEFAGTSTHPIALVETNNNVLIGFGTGVNGGTNNQSYNIDDYVTTLRSRDDTIIGGVGIGFQCADAHLTELELDHMVVKGMTAGTGSGTGFYFPNNPSLIGVLIDCMAINCVTGWNWANTAHATIGKTGGCIAIACNTAIVTGGGSGVAPVALSTLGTLI